MIGQPNFTGPLPPVSGSGIPPASVVGGNATARQSGLATTTSYADDTAAAAAGVAVDYEYRNGSIVQVRVS